jgi:hypothetical protein
MENITTIDGLSAILGIGQDRGKTDIITELDRTKDVLEKIVEIMQEPFGPESELDD